MKFLISTEDSFRKIRIIGLLVRVPCPFDG